MKIDKYISKPIYIFYNFITNLYNFFFSKFEEIFLKKDFVKNHKLNLEGYCKISDLNIPIIDVSKLEVNVVNKYYRRFIFNKLQIEELLKNIFIKNKLADYILNATGFSYGIDYITAYETSHIEGQEKSNSWYANLPHVDKPFLRKDILDNKLWFSLTHLEFGKLIKIFITNKKKENQSFLFLAIYLIAGLNYKFLSKIKMFNKKITVVITSYNSEKYLKESISSVLNQTYKNFELIIIDDGSKDKSRKIINFFKTKDKRIQAFFFKKNIGSEAFARNYAIKKSKGAYISFLDADDIWLEKKLETQVNHLNSNTIMSSALCTYIDKKGNLYSGFFTKYARKFLQNIVFKLGLKGLYIYNPFILSSVIIKKDILKKIYFDEDKFIVGVADLKLWLNILRNNPINQISLINSFLVKIRRRDDSMNINYTQASTRAIYAISNFFWIIKILKIFIYSC